MQDSEDSQINKIFVSTIRSSSGKKKIYNNTAQDLYLNNDLNNTAKSKVKSNLPIDKSNPLTSGKIKSKDFPSNPLTGGKKNNKLSETENTELESETESETDSDSESESEDLEENKSEDEEEKDEDEAEEEEEPVEEESEEKETDTEVEVVNTEYNDDGTNDKDTDLNNEEDDPDCLYQYDELIDDKDENKKAYEVAKENRMTDPQLTHYEKIRLLGIRAKQIAMGAKVMVKYDNDMGAIELAKHELNNKTTPLIIKRQLPDNSYELWKVRELTINNDDDKQLIDDLNDSFNSKKNIYQTF